MTTTVRELYKKLGDYPADAVITIKDIDDVEFAIADFTFGADGLTIVIGEKLEEEYEFEAA